MNKNSQPKKKHPLAQLIGVLISVGVILIFVLALIKSVIPPMFYPMIQNISLWDVCAIIVMIFFAMVFFPKDFKPEE